MGNFIIPKDLDARIDKALFYFWNTRAEQTKRQNNSDLHDHGNRSAVTGGKQMDGFVKLIYDILIMNGISEDIIFTDSDLELPGYYRPNKKWDLLIADRHRLIAAIEFKSQVGPSFGNNFNNRTEEALGSASDIWTAYRKGIFGVQQPPWLGYFMVLEDCKKSNVPVKVHSAHFDVLDEFHNASYKKRYEIFCSKLIMERQYSAACFLTTKIDKNGEISADCPNENLSYYFFIASMLANTFMFFNERRG